MQMQYYSFLVKNVPGGIGRWSLVAHGLTLPLAPPFFLSAASCGARIRTKILEYTRRPSVLFLLAATCAAALPGQVPAPLVVTTTGRDVTITGVTARQSVALLSLAHEVSGFAITVVPRADVLSDDDGDGVVRSSIVGGVPLRSIWVAVDLATGRFVAGYPSEYTPMEGTLLRSAALPNANRIRVPMSLGYVFVARGGAAPGAWMARGGDGAPGDAGALVDGALDLSLDSLEVIGASTARPAALLLGDVLFAVNSTTLEFFLARVE